MFSDNVGQRIYFSNIPALPCKVLPKRQLFASLRTSFGSWVDSDGIMSGWPDFSNQTPLPPRAHRGYRSCGTERVYLVCRVHFSVLFRCCGHQSVKHWWSTVPVWSSAFFLSRLVQLQIKRNKPLAQFFTACNALRQTDPYLLEIAASSIQ